ncbi:MULTISPECIES: hypothetical protein [Nitrosomonas]|uniref:hypothetical protein n=1 Tax=Nitrosomonas TaxID=914 RepID=UPI0019590488|nr:MULTISPECIES: hypothetical protein [Nitrosomonas]
MEIKHAKAGMLPAAPALLYRRTWHRSERAEHAAVIVRFHFKQLALIWLGV